MVLEGQMDLDVSAEVSLEYVDKGETSYLEVEEHRILGGMNDASLK